MRTPFFLSLPNQKIKTYKTDLMLANGVILYPLSTENPHFKWEKKTDKQKNTIQRIRLIIPMNLLAFQALSLKKS